MSTSFVSIHETSSTPARNNGVTQRTAEYPSAAAAASSSTMPIVLVVEESSSSSQKRKHLESSSDDELRKLQDLVLKLTEENNRLTLRCSTCELENKILKEQNERLVQTRRYALQILQGVAPIPCVESSTSTATSSSSTTNGRPKAPPTGRAIGDSAAAVHPVHPKKELTMPDDKAKRAEAWNHKIDQLLEFKALHGHTLVPQSYPENKMLGRWVSRQREYYTATERGDGSKSLLNQERIDQLNKIGFVWKVGQGRIKHKALKKKTAEAEAKGMEGNDL